MQKKIYNIIDKMASSSGMYCEEFVQECLEYGLIVSKNEFEAAADYINSCGIKTVIKGDKIFTKTRFTDFNEEEFCIVDIETNGNSPKNSQIIEIGAIKYKNGFIIDRFESFVFCDYIPEYIEKITNISKSDLKDAPKQKDILKNFKIFLGDSVFIAHNVRFDYNFIAESFDKFSLGDLLNRRLCTIDLAKKTIDSQKYGLSYLKCELNINTGDHHRAYADALSALEVFKISLKNVPPAIKTTEDLIDFSRGAKRKRRRASA